jgi:hypothetical protein
MRMPWIYLMPSPDLYDLGMSRSLWILARRRQLWVMNSKQDRDVNTPFDSA